jgi:DNA-binding IclR family transcriptional regulator
MVNRKPGGRGERPATPVAASHALVERADGREYRVHVRKQDAHIALAVVPGRQLLRHTVSPGTAFPLHRGAIGTVLLAWLPPAEREVLVARSAERWGGTPVDLPRLRAEWEEARTQGWSMSEDEPDAGVLAIAAPLFNAHGTGAGALALTAPAGHLLSREMCAVAPTRS